MVREVQAWKAGLDQLSASRLQSDAFARIPQMEEVFLAREAGTLPEFFDRQADQMNSLGRTLVSSIARHIADQNAMVSAARLAEFVTVFKIPQFRSESDWEDEIRPVEGAGVMILDAPAVVTLLKAGPWQQAKQFLGGETLAGEFFSRYAPGGNGLSVLKTKYAADQTVIDAKFAELKEWVNQQEAANP